MDETNTISNIYKSDISDIVADTGIPWHKLRESTVFVSGATGLIGSALVRVLKAADNEHGLGLRIIGQGRNTALATALSRELAMEFIYGDVRHPATLSALPERLHYIFHCASMTKSSEMVKKPVDVLEVSVGGTKNILDCVRERGPKSFVYLSSMEVYGQLGSGEACEDDLGYLDLSQPRSTYPESKRFCEMMCAAYARQYGLPIKIARLAQTFGAGTPKTDSRVFAQFANSAMAGQELVLHTEGKSRGNYCYTADTLRGLLVILLKGTNGEAYNIANPHASHTIREMADMIAANLYDGRIKVVVRPPEDINKCGYAPDSGYILNTDKLKALGWDAQYGLNEMYGRMILDWQNGGGS